MKMSTQSAAVVTLYSGYLLILETSKELGKQRQREKNQVSLEMFKPFLTKLIMTHILALNLSAALHF